METFRRSQDDPNLCRCLEPADAHGASWECPTQPNQVFARGADPANETCLKCGKHVRYHYGGTEYRCFPRPEPEPEPLATPYNVAFSTRDMLTLTIALRRSEFALVMAAIREPKDDEEREINKSLLQEAARSRTLAQKLEDMF